MSRKRRDDIRAYSARELQKFGCGEDSGIRGIAKREKFKTVTRIYKGNPTTYYHYDSLRPEWQKKIDAQEEADRKALERAEVTAKLIEQGIEPPPDHVPLDPHDFEIQALAYSNAAEYNRRKFDKYANIEILAGNLEGRELDEWIKNIWNRENPKMKTSYKSVMRERKRAKEEGKAAWISSYGNNKGRSIVNDDWLEYFKGLYLIEGGPGAPSCWITTVGRYCDPAKPGYVSKDAFPSADSFMRRLIREVGESAICLAREGWSKWNRKYASYIERDLTKLKAGQVWVSDHAQIDVATKGRKNKKPVFGWITSFVCMKTGKALSCVYHEEAPNSDHIFQAFFLAVAVHGLPEFVYIDNGKDFRCRDFAGGRTSHKLQVDEKKTRSMLAALGVIPMFAKPYNAQAKTIERWHLKIKEALSRHAEGFRGGNVTERPERLAEDIKKGNILDFEVFQGLLMDFIFNYLNKFPSQGKALKGLSADNAWNLENPVKRTVSRDALKLFCMRTTNPLTIRRNGIEYSKFGVTYFADWMIPLKGTKVYMRIAPDNINDAWIFEEDTDEYMGNACIKGLTHPVAQTEIDKAELREAIAAKARDEKTAKALGYVTHHPDTAERLSNMKAGLAIISPAPVPEPERTVSQIMPNSAMQQAVNTRKQREQEGKTDLSALTRSAELEAKKLELKAVRGKILQFESDKPAKDARIRELELDIQRLEAINQ